MTFRPKGTIVRRFMRRASLLAAVIAAAALASAASASLRVSFVPASPDNYSHATRPASAVRLIVVHVTEGTFPATVSWFQNPRAHVSANYVVSREGAVTQMVPNWDVAWHAGNPWVNRHSIGVEHEGFVGIAATFTDAEYRASAELVAGLMRRYLLPIDRRHLIGHNEVPDPFHPGLFGGYSHHTDPGRYWDWRRYLAYVRSYARGVTPPPPAFDVTTSGVAFGAMVSGAVQLSAQPSGQTIDHVDFIVDGTAQTTVRQPPFAFAWDTTRVTNGRHVLAVHAVAQTGATADSSLVVYVKNAPIRITDLGLVAGQTVSGIVHIQPAYSRSPVRAELLVDGLVRATAQQAPFAFDWDTTQETPGPHMVTVRVFGPTQKPAASRTVQVIVAAP